MSCFFDAGIRILDGERHWAGLLAGTHRLALDVNAGVELLNEKLIPDYRLDTRDEQPACGVPGELSQYGPTTTTTERFP